MGRSRPILVTPSKTRAACAFQVSKSTAKPSASNPSGKVDPTRTSKSQKHSSSVAEEMGAALRRSAFFRQTSKNAGTFLWRRSTWRLDGQVLAMGDHMPVHLGSLPASIVARPAQLFPSSGMRHRAFETTLRRRHSFARPHMVMPVFTSQTARPVVLWSPTERTTPISGCPRRSMGHAREIFKNAAHSSARKTFPPWRTQPRRDVAAAGHVRTSCGTPKGIWPPKSRPFHTPEHGANRNRSGNM